MQEDNFRCSLFAMPITLSETKLLEIPLELKWQLNESINFKLCFFLNIFLLIFKCTYILSNVILDY